MTCFHCNGYYCNSDDDQPICNVCHAFLFEYVNTVLKREDDECDSGNEDNEDTVVAAMSFGDRPLTSNNNQQIKTSSSPCNRQAISTTSSSPTVRFDLLPTELLLLILSHCDDLSIWALLQVCSSRLSQIIDREYSDAYWQRHLGQRWPLFTSQRSVSSWKQLYSDLLSSTFCINCFSSCSMNPWDTDDNSWRMHRLRTELKNLMQEPPYGICAVPIENTYLTQWQAAITGPSNSPYEGGIFFLLVNVPHSYPLRPPIVRFLTKIYHPNISRHGDLGLDAILPTNWSLALTLGKVLLCVQSLLTDPYTNVSMEPDIAKLLSNNKLEFERRAQEWTWKYAMHDYVEWNGPIMVASSNKDLGCAASDI